MLQTPKSSATTLFTFMNCYMLDLTYMWWQQPNVHVNSEFGYLDNSVSARGDRVTQMKPGSASQSGLAEIHRALQLRQFQAHGGPQPHPKATSLSNCITESSNPVSTGEAMREFCEFQFSKLIGRGAMCFQHAAQELWCVVAATVD